MNYKAGFITSLVVILFLIVVVIVVAGDEEECDCFDRYKDGLRDGNDYAMEHYNWIIEELESYMDYLFEGVTDGEQTIES